MRDWGRDPQYADGTQLLGRELDRPAQRRRTRRHFDGIFLTHDEAETPILARVVQAIAGEEAWARSPAKALDMALGKAVERLDGNHKSLKHSWREIAEAIFWAEEAPLLSDDGKALSYKELLKRVLPENYDERHRRRFVEEMRERVAQELLRLETGEDRAASLAPAGPSVPLPRDTAVPAAHERPCAHGECRGGDDDAKRPAQGPPAKAVDAGASSLNAKAPRKLVKHRQKVRVHWRVTLVLLSVIAVGIGTHAAYNSYRATEAAPSRTASLPKPQLTGLQYTMVGKNNSTHQTKWSRGVIAEYTDQLEFEATVKNTSDLTTPSTILQPFFADVSQQSAPNQLRLAAGSLSRVQVLSGAPASVTAQTGSGCFGGFTLGSSNFVVVSVGGASRVVPEVGSYKEVGEYHNMGTLTLGGVAIGPIPAGGTITLLFKVHAWRGSSDVPQFSGGQQVRFAPVGSAAFELLGAAAVNEHLTIGVRVEDARCDTAGVDAQVRVGLLVDRKQRSVTMTAYATAVNFGTQELGHITISSKSNVPISIAVSPHSTQLFAHKVGTSCTARFGPIRRLSDGIAEGGVSLGAVKGFEPRLPCGSLDLWRIVEFRATVTDAS